MPQGGIHIESAASATQRPGASLLRRLTEASPDVTDRSDRRTAHLLSTLLLLLAPLAVLSASLQLIESGEWGAVQFTILVVLVAIILSYLLSRTRRFRLAGAITALIPTVGGVAVAATDSADPGWFAFMALNPALGTLLVPIRWSVPLAAANMAVVVAAVFTVSDLDSDVAIVAIMFNAIVSVLLITAAAFRNRLEQDRRADLLAKQRLHESILEGSFGGIAVVDGEVISQANEAFSNLFGVDAGGLAGAHLAQLFDDASSEMLGRAIDQADGRPVEIAAIRSDGSMFDAEILVPRAVAPDAATEVVAIRDITDRKQADEVMQRAQRMESVGRLAAGLVHDTNNELFVISAFADQLVREQKEADRPTDAARQIQDAVDRVSTLIRRVLLIGQGNATEPKVINTYDFVTECCPMWQRVLGTEIDIEVVGEGNGQVYIDRGGFEQVLLNLVLNAGDAIRGEGVVRVGIVGVTLDDAPASRDTGLSPGPFQRITVADTGEGISAEHLTHIFDPFFTTKDDGRGTGLGLYTSRAIVQNSGGMLTAESTEQGTTFIVHLPESSPADGA